MGHMLSSWHLHQWIVQDEEEELSPIQTRDHIFPILEVKETAWPRKVPWRSKKASLLQSILAKR